MNPNNIKNPQDRRMVYNEYLANLQMQINNLAKTEMAVNTLATTGTPPVQPMDTRTLSERLLDVDKQKRVLQQSLIDITDGAEVSKIMNTITDEDVIFLGIAWSDFSKLIKQKFASGILAPLFNEVLQRYKRDYINALSVQQTGHSTEELLLSIRELMRLMPSANQLQELTYTIQNLPTGLVPSAMISSALSATSTLSSLLPTQSLISTLDGMNPIDRAAAEKAINDGLSSITTGAMLQDLTQKLQKASPKEVPSILTTIIKDIVLTKHDKDQLVQAKAIAEQKIATYESKEAEAKSQTGQKKSEVMSKIKAGPQREIAFETMSGLEYEPASKLLTEQAKASALIIEDPKTDAETLEKLTLKTLREWLNSKISTGEMPKSRNVANMSKVDLLQKVAEFKSGSVVPSPPPKARKAYTKKIKASASPFVVVEYDADMSASEFAKQDYADKRSILEDMTQKGIMMDALETREYTGFREIMDRNRPDDETNLDGIYADIRNRLGFGGKGFKQTQKTTKLGNTPAKRITFGGSIASTKPLMVVRPDNIDLDRGVKRETSYMPIGKYVIHKQKLRDNVLLMRTVKGGQIAEIPQMSITPKLGKMLNKIIHGYGFPSHEDLTELDDSDKDIMYKVFKMSKAQGIESIPRPNKTKDEAEFNRFTILKGQILAGNNSKELIKEFKTLLVKLIHSDKILRKDGHNILLDLTALGY